MKNTNIKSKVIAGVVAASMMSCTTAVFAADTTDITNNTSAIRTQQSNFSGFNNFGRNNQNMFQGPPSQQGQFSSGNNQCMFNTSFGQQGGFNQGTNKSN